MNSDYFWQLLLWEPWAEVQAQYLECQGPMKLTSCAWNRTVQLIVDAIEVDGWDEAFGFGCYDYLDGDLWTADNRWPIRDILKELAASPLCDVLSTPRSVELYATPEGATYLVNDARNLNYVSGMSVYSTKDSTGTVLSIVASQIHPCTFMISVSTNRDDLRFDGMTFFGRLDGSGGGVAKSNP